MSYGGYVLPFYVVAVCAPMLLSGSRRMVIFGVANLVMVALLGWLLVRGVISLWCVGAAVCSVAVDLEVRAVARRETRVATAAPA